MEGRIVMQRVEGRTSRVEGQWALSRHSTLDLRLSTFFSWEQHPHFLQRAEVRGQLHLCLQKHAAFGGARVGYVNPDETTFEYLKGRPHAPKGADWEAAVERWRAMASDADAVYDDVVNLRAEDIGPTVTWGINPGQAIFIDEDIPSPEQGKNQSERDGIVEASELLGAAATVAVRVR